MTVTERLMRQIAGARVIAADGGMRHAATLDLSPEIWVGDFDSTSQSLAETYQAVPRLPFPPGKNETDGQLAVDVALKQGAKTVVLAGAMGGDRSDHAIFHMFHACQLGAAGIDVLMTSGLEEARPLRHGAQTFDLPAGSLFSVLGFSALHGLSITGARYPLRDFHLPFGHSRTISNVAEGTVTIDLRTGTAVLIARPYDRSGA